MEPEDEDVELLAVTELKEEGSNLYLPVSTEEDEPEDSSGVQSLPPSGSSPGAGGVDGEGKKLRKELNIFHMVGFVVGEIIGSGIFVSPFVVLSHAGSAGMSLIAWVLGGVFSVCGALCYIELGTLLKISGGEYTIFRETYSFRELKKPWLEVLGSLTSFLYAWATCFVIRPASLGIISLTFGSYVTRPFYLDCELPPNTVKLFALSGVSKSSP